MTTEGGARLGARWGIPIVLLAFHHRELEQVREKVKAAFDNIFIWNGESKMLLTIIKLVEDQRNAEADTDQVGVRVIIRVEAQDGPDKGKEIGAHIFSGAVMDPHGIEDLMPDWKEQGAPIEADLASQRISGEGFTVHVSGDFEPVADEADRRELRGLVERLLPDTFARHGLGVVAVIGNDAGWTQIARDQVTYLQFKRGCRGGVLGMLPDFKSATSLHIHCKTGMPFPGFIIRMG